MTTNDGENVRQRRFGWRRVAVAAAVMLMVTAGVLKGMPSEDVSAGSQVTVDNFSFAPTTTIVAVGTTVTWTNHDDIPHNVVSPDQKFKSPVLDTDQTFTHTFDAAGTYEYDCSIHPRMTGKVVVR